MATYKSIITATEGMKKITGLNLKIRQAIALTKLINRMSEETAVYFSLREQILQKYGDYEEEKSSYYIPEENRKTVNSLLKELDEETIQLDKVKLNVSEDTEIDALTVMTTEDFVEFIFEEDEENGSDRQ